MHVQRAEVIQLGLSDGKAAVPWKLSMTIIYRELRLLYTAEQEAGLAHLGRSSLCRRAVFWLYISRGRKLWWTFSAHIVNICT